MMKGRLWTVGLLLWTALSCPAQKRVVQYKPYIDLRPMHFGILVGMNLQDIEFENVGPQTITLDDGTRYITYPCNASVMKPCCRMFEEYFGMPNYINLDFADLPAPTDKNRPILYRETVAESKETLPDDAERLYASAEELKEAKCVVILMELSPDVDMDTVEEVSRRLEDYANEWATIIWASTFTKDISYRISLVGIF